MKFSDVFNAKKKKKKSEWMQASRKSTGSLSVKRCKSSSAVPPASIYLLLSLEVRLGIVIQIREREK